MYQVMQDGNVVRPGDHIRDFHGTHWEFVEVMFPPDKVHSGIVRVRRHGTYHSFFGSVFRLTIVAVSE
jgi:hypothetical protein